MTNPEQPKETSTDDSSAAGDPILNELKDRVLETLPSYTEVDLTD
ncbi:hypothetical protein GCM10027167_82600 [Nocardia heshunensis]